MTATILGIYAQYQRNTRRQLVWGPWSVNNVLPDFCRSFICFFFFKIPPKLSPIFRQLYFHISSEYINSVTPHCMSSYPLIANRQDSPGGINSALTVIDFEIGSVFKTIWWACFDKIRRSYINTSVKSLAVCVYRGTVCDAMYPADAIGRQL